MSTDLAITSRLADIATQLETLAAVTPEAALRRDPALPPQLKRIQDALVAELQQIESELSDIQDALGGLVPTTGPRTVSFVVQDPEGTKVHGGRGTRSFGVWLNNTGSTFTLSRIQAVADADNYAFQLFKSASFMDIGTTNDVLLAAITCADDGTSGYTADVTIFDSGTIEDGKWLIWEHVSGSADSLSILVKGSLA